jgi:FMN reductase
MALRTIVGFSGNLARPSRTRALVEIVTSRAAERLGLAAAMYDLDDLAPSLGAARRLADLDGVARDVVEAILAADLLVIGSPTYKGSYAGLFKHLIDLLDPLSLTGKPIVLTATGGSDRHALVIEHQLRPLFGFFAAHTAPTGIYATERDLQDGRIVSAQVNQRIDQGIAEAGRLLGHVPSPLLLAAE